MPAIAETSRLVIRTWESHDVNLLCTLTREEGIAEFSVSGYSNFSKEQATKWIQNEVDRFEKYRLGKFAVILKETNQPIGISGLFHAPPPNESEVELNYRYPKIYRGRGFATEAALAILNYGFENLKLRRINANADLRNAASHKVLERLGMKWVENIEYHGKKAGRWSLENPARN